MKIWSVTDEAFRPYGKVVEGFDTAELTKAMEEKTPVPDDTVYVGSVPELEALPIAQDLADRFYGGMPIQLGYCNGMNHKLNALEYHRDSELNYAATDAILLVGKLQDVTPGTFTYDTSKVEAFLAPKGTLVEVYATTLHYAPVSVDGKKFRVTIVLPKGTNEPVKTPAGKTGEDSLRTAVNKWLIAHEESGLGADGAHIGLIGENITL